MYSKQDESLAFWDRMASRYDEHRGQNENYSRLARRIADDVTDADCVLDMGAGTGIVALEIAKNVGLVEAIDYSPEMIAIAQDKASEKGVENVNFSVQDACEIDFPDGSFDAVVLCNTLHVMESPERGVAGAKRVLKSDGLLVVPTACCGETLQARVQAEQMKEERGFPIQQLFTFDSLCELIQAHGFTVTKRDQMPYRMPLAYLLARPADGS